DLRQRKVAIDAVHRLARCREHRERWTGRSHHDGDEPTGLLRGGEVVLDARFGIEPFMGGVADNTDDRDPRGVRRSSSRAERDTATDWILVRKVLLHKLLIDDHDGWCALAILIGEHSTPFEWDPHRLEEARGCDA